MLKKRYTSLSFAFIVKRAHKMKKEALTFEKALETLETIVSQLEKGDLSLEDALQHFEKGIVLSKECQVLLTQAELKIEQLSLETIQNADRNNDA